MEQTDRQQKWMDGWMVDGLMDRWMNGWPNSQTGGHMHACMDWHIWKHGWTDRQTDGWTDRRQGRQTDKWLKGEWNDCMENLEIRESEITSQVWVSNHHYFSLDKFTRFFFFFLGTVLGKHPDRTENTYLPVQVIFASSWFPISKLGFSSNTQCRPSKE